MSQSDDSHREEQQPAEEEQPVDFTEAQQATILRLFVKALKDSRIAEKAFGSGDDQTGVVLKPHHVLEIAQIEEAVNTPSVIRFFKQKREDKIAVVLGLLGKGVVFIGLLFLAVYLLGTYELLPNVPVDTTSLASDINAAKASSAMAESRTEEIVELLKSLAQKTNDVAEDEVQGPSTDEEVDPTGAVQDLQPILEAVLAEIKTVSEELKHGEENLKLRKQITQLELALLNEKSYGEVFFKLWKAREKFLRVSEDTRVSLELANSTEWTDWSPEIRRQKVLEKISSTSPEGLRAAIALHEAQESAQKKVRLVYVQGNHGGKPGVVAEHYNSLGDLFSLLIHDDVIKDAIRLLE